MISALKTIGMIVLAISTLVSCKKDTPIPQIIEGFYENGYFITNEGNFGTGNGSISFVSNEGVVENNVFENVNNFLLGDVVQSMKIIGNNAYVMVNNSAKIEVVSVDSMKSITTINIEGPRYIAKVSDKKAYITTWGLGFGNDVLVLDLISNTIMSSIICGTGPEGIAISNGFAYVCNLGGYTTGNTITVIDVESDLVISTLSVGDNPSSAVVDVDGNVWIICRGEEVFDPTWSFIEYHTSAELVKINTLTNQIENVLVFSDSTEHPKTLTIDDLGINLYYNSLKLYSFNINNTELPTTALITKSFYGLGYNEGYIYGSVSPWDQSGWSFQYSVDGSLIDSISVGIGPNGYCFK